MAEALMNRWGKHHFRAFSAGLNPKGEVDPNALELISRHGLPTEGLASKSWKQFLAAGEDLIDFIIMLRDRSAGEECLAWPGRQLTACWNIVDPAAQAQSPHTRANAFRRVFQELENRIKIMACLRTEAIDRLSLRQQAETRALQMESRA
jgi:arsenate reductase